MIIRRPDTSNSRSSSFRTRIPSTLTITSLGVKPASWIALGNLMGSKDSPGTGKTLASPFTKFTST